MTDRSCTRTLDSIVQWYKNSLASIFGRIEELSITSVWGARVKDGAQYKLLYRMSVREVDPGC